MAERERNSSDRIGKPDPENEPSPPKIGVAGKLGEVGEQKLEETDPRSLGAAAEQGELMSERQVLKNEVGAGLQRSAQSAQQSEYEGHCWLDRRPTSSVATDFWPTTGMKCVLV